MNIYATLLFVTVVNAYWPFDNIAWGNGIYCLYKDNKGLITTISLI